MPVADILIQRLHTVFTGGVLVVLAWLHLPVLSAIALLLASLVKVVADISRRQH